MYLFICLSTLQVFSLVFSEYRFFTYLGKLIPRYLILFDVMINGVVSLISLLFSLFFFYGCTLSIWSPHARGWIRASAATCATAVAVPEPRTQCTGPGIESVPCSHSCCCSLILTHCATVGTSIISAFDSSLLMYKNATDFCEFILYSATLPNSLMSFSSFLVAF